MPRRIKRATQKRRHKKSQRRSIRNLFRNRQSVPTIFNHQLETLEPRVLLTTLVGGDIFEFKAPDPASPGGEGTTIRVIINGDTIVELIGADVRLEPDGFGGLTQVVSLGDLPGTIYGSDSAAQNSDIENGIDILGGVGGADGITPFNLSELNGALMQILDPLTGNVILATQDGTDSINMQAIASMGLLGNGTTFGLNVGQVETGTGTDATSKQVIQLVQLDTANVDGTPDVDGTVNAVIQAATLKFDIQSNLTSGILNPDAYAIDPTTGLAYAVSNEVLYRINRSSGVITTIGNVSSETLNFAALDGEVSADLQGLATDSAGNFLSIYMDALLNNGLYTSDATSNSNPQASVLGDFGSNVNLTAIAVDQDPNSPAWGVLESSGTYSLIRFTRINGEIQTPTVIGVIQDSLGRNVTEINSIELESTGDLYVVATRPDINISGTREVFRINSNTAIATAVNVVVFADGVVNDDVTGVAIDESNGAENGILYATVRIGTQDMLIRIDRSIAVSPSDSTADSENGAVPDNTDGLANDDRFLFYSVYDNSVINPSLINSTLDLVPQTNVASQIDGGGDLLDEYDVVALTVTADDQMYMVAANATSGGFDLYSITRNTPGGPVQSVELVTSLLVGTDNILNINAIEANPDTGVLYFIGDTGANSTLYSITLAANGDATIAAVDELTVNGAVTAVTPAAMGASQFGHFTALSFAQDSAGAYVLYAVEQAETGDLLVNFDAATAAGSSGDIDLTANGVIVGRDFSTNNITDATLLSDLGIDLTAPFAVTLRDGTNFTVDLSSLANTDTVLDLRNLVNASRATLALSGNLADGDIFTLNDGTNPAITFEMDSISTATQLSDLNVINGAAGAVTVTNTIAITRQDNTTITIDGTALTYGAATTLGTLIDDINDHANNQAKSTTQLTAVPTAGEMITVNGTAFTFVAGVAGANQVSIDSANAITIGGLLATAITGAGIDVAAVSDGAASPTLTLVYSGANAKNTLTITTDGAAVTTTAWGWVIASLNTDNFRIELVDTTPGATTFAVADTMNVGLAGTVFAAGVI
ncbi:MAG: hypothetical protein JKX85_03445, partial [Phycisphaeraceae bacterium]|nr:hypothetical protein [Phycisphaeraceae bacterium]